MPFRFRRHAESQEIKRRRAMGPRQGLFRRRTERLLEWIPSRFVAAHPVEATGEIVAGFLVLRSKLAGLAERPGRLFKIALRQGIEPHRFPSPEILGLQQPAPNREREEEAAHPVR